MKVLITRKIPGEYIEKLKNAGFEVDLWGLDRPMSREELLNKVVGVDAILSLLTDKIDAEVMEKAGSQLKIVSNYAVGFDNIDLDEAKRRGILVTNTPSKEVNEAVAEHTWALILALSRRIVEADEATRRGGYHGWDPDIFLGRSLVGKTLGIIGLGNIGSMVAKRAAGYEMNILYNKHNPDPKAEEELGIKFASLDELLSLSDFVSLHVPLTDETRGMINKDAFSKMKRGSYLINTARGAIVCEQDLAEALRTGILAGAALDVFENEPNINPELLAMENVILTPHIASSTWEARLKMTDQAISAILDFFSGRTPENVVNK
ncbi:MAG: D-glycerate dehydrogenase [Patescibacteria group bacterium]|nr:MAG: D-glycerate dehydrogenase [Patescibacteria group bacterium]